jgi:Transmembrane protein 43
MAYQETTSTGWFGRIGNSIKGMLFGLLLIPISLIVLVMNERNAVADIRANQEISKNVVSVPSDPVNPSYEGKLVHLNGEAKTDDILENAVFGVSENAIRLTWKAQVYQWEETSTSETQKKLGGGEETVTTYHYKQIWSDKLIDSSGFKDKGHENTTTKNFSPGFTQSENVTLGAFKLPTDLVSQIESEQPLPLSQIPTALTEKGSVSNGIFHTGAPASPKIGDEKVEFFVTKPGPVSVMAVQTGETFAPYIANNGKRKFLLYEGLLSAEEIVKGEERKAALMRWILRALGVILMWFGFLLLSKPLSVVADVIPLVGSIVGFLTGGVAFLLAGGISLLVIAASWIAFRPVLGISIIVIAVACLVLMFRMHKKSAGTAAASGPA